MADSPRLSVDAFPLTQRQMLFWIDRQLFPTAPYHNVALTINLYGELDVERLERAYVQTIRDIDFFRIFVDPDEPRQWIVQDDPPQLEHVDLSREPERLNEWMAARSLELFEMPGWLFAPALVHLSPEHHVIYILLHHIIADGASAMMSVEHLADRYCGREPPTRGSFRDYVEFEQQYRTSTRYARDERYWQAKVGAGVPTLRFYGFPRTARSVDIERTWVDGGRERLDGLLARASEETFQLINPSVSRLVAMATVLFAFMSRTTENRELVIGTPVANRSARFVNTCGLIMEQTFLKVDIEEGETFATLAQKVRGDVFRSFRHGQYCLSDRGLDYVTLNLLTQTFTAFGDLGVKVRLQAAVTLGAPPSQALGDLRGTFGVQIHDFEGTDGLLVALDFHKGTLPEAVRARAGEHFMRVVDAFVRDLETRIDSVDLLHADERSKVLATGHGAEPRGQAADVVTRIAQTALAHPHETAVIAPDGRLTYEALEQRANRLARHLQSLGVGPEARVGVHLPRGTDELVTLLATLKAGGAYVPLDPAQPMDRLQLIVEDASPQVLVTHRGMPLATATGVRTLLLDRLSSELDALDPMSLELSYDPAQLAYVLFTSGSTGRPKGVEIPRGAFANFLRSMAHTPGLGRSDRLLAITTTMFDIAGLELFLPLWVGATVQIVDRETAVDPKRLRRVLEREPVTVMQATPATWRLLLEAGWRGNGRLRIFCGGEALSVDLARRLVECSSELWNLYGPTETTVWSTVARIEPNVESITIGRPIDHTQIYIFDAARQVVPIGVVGELCIGGRGLARGYRGRADLTADRFVQNPYGPPGDRIYRTGDLARMLDSGEVECLGRLDHQVKIRGFRVELGEIEAVLRSADGVGDVVVVARRSSDQDVSLAAYYTGTADRTALQHKAVARLPQYMQPSAYVRLGAFPLNANGKVDRKALPDPEEEAPPMSQLKLPCDDAEARIAAIWRDVLDVSAVGVDQDFFALGGSSPLALEVRNRIEKELAIEMPLRLLFESPTVENVARALGSAHNLDEPIVVTLRRGDPRLPPLFCLLGVRLYQELALSLPAGRSVIGIHVPIRFVPGRDPRPTVLSVARKYVKLICERQPTGPYFLAGLCFGGIVAFETARQLIELGHTVDTVALLDAQLPRALVLDRSRQVRGLFWRAVEDPRRIRPFVQRRVQKVLARLQGQVPVPALRWLKLERSLSAVELDVLGPEALAATKDYDRVVTRIAAKLLVFRALDRQLGVGTELDPALGWDNLATKIFVHGVPGDHLEILQRPRVEAVATALGEAIAPSEVRSARAKADTVAHLHSTIRYKCTP